MRGGLILSAPASGSGKTVVTLAVLRALRRRGVAVTSAKSGPDYIDPAYHEAACGYPGLTLDAWAMSEMELKALASQHDGLLVVEGAMGLFDGAPPKGRGSTADLAEVLDLPVILVVDAARQSHSVAALVQGFASHRTGVRIAGVILNRVGSARHEAMLRSALSNFAIIGAIPATSTLQLRSRHLGLVQAGERTDLEDFLEAAADIAEKYVDLVQFQSLAAPLPQRETLPKLVPLIGKQIAVAKDAAFSFIYQHVLQGWLAEGASIRYFSPLADEGPDADCDAVFLPGGYPELHGEKLSLAKGFRKGMQLAAARGATIYGECGGYMVLGRTLVTADAVACPMLGLLNLDTSFATPTRHLGYRNVTFASGPLSGSFSGHEFHYATTLRAEGEPLFQAKDADGTSLGRAGLSAGNVSGSFIHLIAKRLPA